MNNKLQGKDLITIGIYTALYIVAIFVASVSKCYSVDFYVLSRYFIFAGRSIFHYAGNKGTEIWGGYHLGRDCWLALFGAWHGINTSVFCCCLYHCTIHPFKRWV